MEFWLGKITWAIFAPSHLLIILLVLFLLLPMRLWLRSFLCTGIAFFFFMAMMLPLGDWALVPLEQCAAKSAKAPKVDGFIVLGGAVDNEATLAAKEAQFNSAVGRYLGMLKLMKQYPQATAIYSGGPGSPKYPTFREADYVKQSIEGIGMDASRLVLENDSKNTVENVAHTKALFSQVPGQDWLIVTSAFHMPRALSLFQAAGAATQTRFYAYPTDFRTAGRVSLQITFDLPTNLGRLDAAAKEYLGLAVNRLIGRSQEFLPCGS